MGVALATVGTDFDVAHFIHSCGAQGMCREEEMEGTGTVRPVFGPPPWQGLESSLLGGHYEAATPTQCQCSTTIAPGSRGGWQDEGGVVGQVGRSLHAALLPPGGLWSRLSNTRWSDMSYGILRWRVWATLVTTAAAAAATHHAAFDRLPCGPPACSGGKDSCYNMVLCQTYGHEVGERIDALKSLHIAWNCSKHCAPTTAASRPNHHHCLCRSWRWPTCCQVSTRPMTWTATCTRQWGTSWWAPMPSACACRCTADASPGSRQTRWARGRQGAQPCCAAAGCFETALGVAIRSDNIVAAVHILVYCLVSEYLPLPPAPCPRLQRLVYEDTEGDEVEDLYCLLAYIKQRHPDITAVSSGAIASGAPARLPQPAAPSADSGVRGSGG